MQSIHIWNYAIILTGKQDGSVRDPKHWVYEKFLSAEQIHENRILELIGDEANLDDRQGDAILSSGCGVGIYTADCVPIAILGKDHFTVVHGSRKTLYKGILQDSVKKMCRQNEEVVDMHVYIWPCISQAVYEVGQEFYNYFPEDVLEQRDEKIYLDLRGYCIWTLKSLWVSEDAIQTHTDCSYLQNNHRFSHRRGDKGRNFMWVRRHG